MAKTQVSIEELELIDTQQAFEEDEQDLSSIASDEEEEAPSPFYENNTDQDNDIIYNLDEEELNEAEIEHIDEHLASFLQNSKIDNYLKRFS